MNIQQTAKKFNEQIHKYHDDHQAVPNQSLYHYTSYAGLSGILQSKEIWLTSHKYLNDPSEIEHGKRIILNYINQKIANKALRDFMQFFFNDIINRGYYTFVTSFCEKKDYLPAWRYYGDDGAGFSIGFKKEYFSTGTSITDKRMATLIFKVEYAEKDSQQVKDIFGIANETMCNWTSRGPNEIEPLLEGIFAALITIISSIKNPDYETEHEWRMCLPRIYFEKENKWHPYDFPVGCSFVDKIDNPKVAPFLKNIRSAMPRLKAINKFDYKDIDTIYVGPRLDFMAAKIAIEKILMDGGISELELSGIAIIKSKRPYE